MNNRTEWPCLIQKSKGRFSASSSWGCWLNRLPFAPSLPARARRSHSGLHQGKSYQLWLESTSVVIVDVQVLLYRNQMNADTNQLLRCTNLNAFVLFYIFPFLFGDQGVVCLGHTWWLLISNLWPFPSWGHRSWLGSKLAKYRAPRNSGKFREWSGVQDLLLLGQIWSDLFSAIQKGLWAGLLVYMV